VREVIMEKIRNILIAAAVASLMTGCVQMSPKVQKGALIGAGTGAVITAVAGSAIVTGAVIGAVVGGGLGHLQN